MKLSYNLMPPSFQNIQPIALASERAGLHSIAVADSPLISRELFVSCAECLRETKSLNVMTAVTNPLTRHPSVAASAIATLCEMAPGRILIGIATGDSAAWGAGLRPAKVSVLSDYIVALKQLLRGEVATWQGHEFSLQWDGYDPSSAPPIYVACSGPRVLRMAVEVADGIIPAMGYAPQNIAHVKQLVADACVEFERDIHEFAIWWYSEFRFGESAEEVLKAHLGADSQWLVTVAYKDLERGEKLVQRAKSLGLYDWLYARASRLCGTPAEIGARLQSFQKQGLDHWCLWQDGGEGDYNDIPVKLGETLRIVD